MNDEPKTGSPLPSRPRRGESRFTLRRPVLVRPAGEGAFEDAHTVDLNRSGLQLEQRSRPAPGSRLELRLRTPGSEELALEGTVLWAKDAPRAGLCRVGVRLDLDPRGRIDLDRYLAEANLAAARELGGKTPPAEGPAERPSGQERRAHVRVPANQQVMLRCADWVAYQRLHTVNISKGGVLVGMRSPPAPGTPMELRLLLPGDEDVLVQGKAVRVEPPRPGSLSSRVAIALEPDAATAERLARFLEAAERELAKAARPPGTPPPLPLAKKPAGAAVTPAPTVGGTDGGGGVGAAAEAPAGAPAETAAPLSLDPPRATPEVPLAPRRPLWSGATRVPTEGAAPVLCVDLGTSAIKAAVVRGGEVVVIRGEDGCASIPAIVWVRQDGEVALGEAARQGLLVDPGGAIHSVKPLLGRSADAAVTRRIGLAQTCAVYSDHDGALSFEVHGTDIGPLEVVAMALRRLRDLAERQVGSPVERAVVALPHPFGAEEEAAFRQACWMAGLALVGSVPEPVAAALAAGHGGGERKLVGVFDLGGGSFDFSVLALEGGRASVLASCSDHWLSGAQLDLLVAQYAAAEALETLELDLRSNVQQWRLLVFAAEEAKRQLSSLEQAEVAALGISGKGGSVDVRSPLTREAFGSLAADALRTAGRSCLRALREAGLRRADLDSVVLSGAGTRLHAVSELAASVLGPAAARSPEPELLVALGAAAAARQSPAAAPTPRPAALAAPVCPETLGLSIADGRTARLLDGGAPLPALGRMVMGTSTDDQAEMEVRVVAGGSERTEDNRLVGACCLRGLGSGPAGSVEVEVQLEVREAGLLTVTARDLSSGRRARAHFELE